jgi:hypothetical protein
MKRHWSVAMVAILLAAGLWLVFGQSNARAELQTMVSPADRFQVVQTARQTLRVNRYNGETYELSERAGRQFWKKITWQDPLPANAVTPNRVNFQVATQGPRGQTYLWEISSGRTWYLATDKDNARWQIVDEE